MKKTRALFLGQSLQSIKVADQPLPLQPKVSNLTIDEFNKLVSKHRGHSFQYDESITTSDESFKFSDQQTALAQPFLQHLVVCWINQQVGYGVYTECAIPKGAQIAIYTGELVRKFDPTSTYSNGGFVKTKDSKPQICAVDAKARSGIASLIQSTLSKEEFYSTALYPLQFRNVTAQMYQRDGISFSVLVAAEDIPAGVQLLIDYGLEYWDALRSKGIIERAFSAQNHCETPPADLFTFSDEITLPAMIYILDQKPLTKDLQQRLLSYLARFHHSLIKALPLHTQENLYNYLTELKKQTSSFASYIKLVSNNGTLERVSMVEAFENNLSALALAAAFKPDITAKPLFSRLELQDNKPPECTQEDKRRLVIMQVEAAKHVKENNMQAGHDLFNQVLNECAVLYKPYCPLLQFGNTEIVVHLTIFNVHVQLIKLFYDEMPEKSFYHAFVAYQMMQHPTLTAQLLPAKQDEIKTLFSKAINHFWHEMSEPTLSY
ncbi:MAG: SET domain-containing protein [Pseudomonadota bacterium]|nr:SET domain-containing protein [Pseudomonadota bacterium]